MASALLRDVVIPKLLSRFHSILADRWTVERQAWKWYPRADRDQSRGSDESVWINEVWRSDRDHALLTAQAKAQITGRSYRLLDERGVQLDQVDHQ